MFLESPKTIKLFQILTNHTTFAYIILKGESHVDFRMQCVIMTLAGGGVSLMTF